jgi:hypothetical protein
VSEVYIMLDSAARAFPCMGDEPASPFVPQQRADEDLALLGPGSRSRAGAIVCRDALVREFLPTLVQVGREGA